MKGRRRLDAAESGIGRAALMGALIAGVLAGGVATVAALPTLDLGPRVGDILVFRQGARAPTDWDFMVTRAAAGQAACNLQPAMMVSRGGSLVVEERLAKAGSFLVHWAGGPTSGRADCGESADLLVPRTDLQLLSNAVGGPGVERTVFTRF